MSIIIFILVLVALIVVHELGHFVVAKLSGMRVDEFGLGYPAAGAHYRHEGGDGLHPQLASVRRLRTHLRRGRDGRGGAEGPRAFSSRPRILQALVLVAGIAMNLLFAWVLISPPSTRVRCASSRRRKRCMRLTRLWSSQACCLALQRRRRALRLATPSSMRRWAASALAARALWASPTSSQACR